MKTTITTAILTLTAYASLHAEPIVQNLWSTEPPGPAPKVDGTERDLSKPEDKPVAGRRIIKLGHVAAPQMHVFLPPKEKANGGSVVILPGGGFHILAWDLEGTEVAEWLNSLGFAAAVVKYRVPTGHHGDALDDLVPKKAAGPVMDAQRAVSLVRSRASEWSLDPKRVGILGFSAGGSTAGHAALLGERRLYEKNDAADDQPCAPNYSLLIYPAYFVGDDGALKPHLKVTKETPPAFFLMSADDPVNCENCTALFTALKRQKVPAELHIFPRGGHGYGLRATDEPVTRWPALAAEWLRGR